MSQFYKALRIIKKHLVDYTEQRCPQPWEDHYPYGRIPCTYVYVDLRNQTYYIGRVKNIDRIQDIFANWKVTGETAQLPKSFHEVFEMASHPMLFAIKDPNKRALLALRAELTQVDTLSA